METRCSPNNNHFLTIANQCHNKSIICIHINQLCKVSFYHLSRSTDKIHESSKREEEEFGINSLPNKER